MRAKSIREEFRPSFNANSAMSAASEQLEAKDKQLAIGQDQLTVETRKSQYAIENENYSPKVDFCHLG